MGSRGSPWRGEPRHRRSSTRCVGERRRSSEKSNRDFPGKGLAGHRDWDSQLGPVGPWKGWRRPGAKQQGWMRPGREGWEGERLSWGSEPPVRSLGRVRPAAGGMETGPTWLAPRAPPAVPAVFLPRGFCWKPARRAHAKQGHGALLAANNRSQSRPCCCRGAGWHGAGLTSKRQSPPMSPLLSKQVGASPSSRQHFRAHRPEAPAPMMATRRAAMSRGVVVARTAGEPRGAPHGWGGGAEPGRSRRGDTRCCWVGGGRPLRFPVGDQGQQGCHKMCFFQT